MRILSSGLLLGFGVFTVATGFFVAESSTKINGLMIVGVCFMSLGLFALRFGHPDTEIEAEEIPEGPVEYVPPGGQRSPF